MGGLENWTFFMDIICTSSLTVESISLKVFLLVKRFLDLDF